MRNSLVVVLVFALVLSLSGPGCTTRFSAKSAPLPKNTRIGLLVVDRGGKDVRNSLGQTYIYEQLIKEDMIPVTLNEFSVRDLYNDTFKRKKGSDWTRMLNPLPGGGGGNANEARTVTQIQAGDRFKPLLVPTLMEYLQKQKVEYLLVVHTWASAKDERLKALLIRVEDMVVVGAKYYDYNFMKPFCIPMTLAFGLSALICPWMYLKSDDKAKYEMIKDLIKDLM